MKLENEDRQQIQQAAIRQAKGYDQISVTIEEVYDPKAHCFIRSKRKTTKTKIPPNFQFAKLILDKHLPDQFIQLDKQQALHLIEQVTQEIQSLPDPIPPTTQATQSTQDFPDQTEQVIQENKELPDPQ